MTILKGKQMTKLEFNGERIEAKHGETLVQSARRHGSFVWFLCDGRGICQTCQCNVIAGAGNLSELSELERAGLGEECRRSGYRLGCQARLMGTGRVSVVSRVEELRRRARDILLDSRGHSFGDRLKDLSGDLLNVTVEQLTALIIVSPQAIPQFVKSPPTPARLLDYTRDMVRIAGRLLMSESWLGPSNISSKF